MSKPLELVYDKNKGNAALNIMCEGDSVTFGFQLPTTDRYSSQLQQRYPKSWSISNVAVSGSKVADLVSRAAVVDATLSPVAKYNILCVMVGINDLYNSGGVGAAPATMWSDYKAYLAARRAAGWKIVLGTPTVVIDVGARFVQYEADRQTLISLIKSEPTQYDVLAPTGDDRFVGNPNGAKVSYFFQDGAHPTREGSTVYANIFESAVKELLVKLSIGN